MDTTAVNGIMGGLTHGEFWTLLGVGAILLGYFCYFIVHGPWDWDEQDEEDDYGEDEELIEEEELKQYQ